MKAPREFKEMVTAHFGEETWKEDTKDELFAAFLFLRDHGVDQYVAIEAIGTVIGAVRGEFGQ